MDSKIQKKYYKEVPTKYIQIIDDFRRTHETKSIDFKGQKVEYICSGTGNIGFLTFHGFSCIGEICYKDFLKHENTYKVLSPTISCVQNLDELSNMVNAILKREDIDRLIIKGSSYGGFIAQAYFDRNFNKVDGLILSHTYPPRKSAIAKSISMLKLAKFLPFFIVRRYVKRFLLKLSDFKLPDEEVMAKLRLARGFVSEIVSKKITKDILLSQLMLLIDFDAHEEYKIGKYEKWNGIVLTLTADNDMGFKYNDILINQYPNVEPHIFQNSGHASGILREADYTRFVAEFLKKINS